MDNVKWGINGNTFQINRKLPVLYNKKLLGLLYNTICFILVTEWEKWEEIVCLKKSW